MTSVIGLESPLLAVLACLGFSRKNQHSAFGDFCNTIGPKRTSRRWRFLSGRSNSSKILRGIEDDRRWHTIATPKIVGPISEIRRLRHEHTDRLLTLLAILLALEMFVFAPLQAVGVFIFHGFAIAALLAIIGGMLIISHSSKALAVMSVCFAANVVVFFIRLFYQSHYNLYVLAAAWLAIAITLGAIVSIAVFRRGRVTYHRIIGAMLLYLLVALAFATLFTFVGLSLPDAFKGITFEDNSALANSVFYLSFVTLTSTGYGDIVPLHPIARSLCNIESVIGQLYPATLLARLVTLELRQALSSS